LRRLDWLARADDVLDKPTPARAVKYFGELRTHASSFARSQNDYGGVGRSHGTDIVASPESFGNRNAEIVRISLWKC
jgi:hypothetical protein